MRAGFIAFVAALAAAACVQAGQDRPEVSRKPSEGLKDVVIDAVAGPDEYEAQAGLGGVIVLRWRLQGDRIAFCVSAKTEGWAAIGFDPERAMLGADMIVAYAREGEPGIVEDQFCTGEFGPHKPDEDLGGTDDVSEFAISKGDGVLTFEFRRALDTGDKFDRRLDPGRELSVIWAVGKSDDPRRKHALDGGVLLTLSPPAKTPSEPGSTPEQACPPARTAPIWPIHAGFMDLVVLLCVVAWAIARRKRKDQHWLPKHATLGLVIPLVLLGSLATAFYMVDARGGGHFNGPHAFIGAVGGAILLSMPVLGLAMFASPSKRQLFRTMHVWAGRVAILAAAAGSLTGLFAAGIF